MCQAHPPPERVGQWEWEPEEHMYEASFFESQIVETEGKYVLLCPAEATPGQ
jgi:hypothetical protein